jgi:hypothetical protein
MYRWLLICNILGWPSGVDELNPSGSVYEYGDGAGMHIPSSSQLSSDPRVTAPIRCPFGKERYCG